MKLTCVMEPVLDQVFIVLVFISFQSINPLIAKKMQEDKGRDYMNARRVAKEYEVVTKGLNRNAPSVPPQNTPEELKQVCLSNMHCFCVCVCVCVSVCLSVCMYVGPHLYTCLPERYILLIQRLIKTAC